jgi:hypothetical protein
VTTGLNLRISRARPWAEAMRFSCARVAVLVMVLGRKEGWAVSRGCLVRKWAFRPPREGKPTYLEVVVSPQLHDRAL